MENIYGITGIRATTFIGSLSHVEKKLNEFFTEHDGNIVEVLPVPATGYLVKVIVLYKEGNEDGNL